jgi:hypothetical protein
MLNGTDAPPHVVPAASSLTMGAWLLVPSATSPDIT